MQLRINAWTQKTDSWFNLAINETDRDYKNLTGLRLWMPNDSKRSWYQTVIGFPKSLFLGWYQNHDNETNKWIMFGPSIRTQCVIHTCNWIYTRSGTLWSGPPGVGPWLPDPLWESNPLEWGHNKNGTFIPDVWLCTSQLHVRRIETVYLTAKG